MPPISGFGNLHNNNDIVEEDLDIPIDQLPSHL